jgi:uncharacterized protein YaiE (UPF0345 family)
VPSWAAASARRVLTLALLAAVAALAASPGHADRGVGVSTGEMIVATTMSPGGGYHLPGIKVINTGDEPSEYQLSISYLDGQPGRRPDAGWFSFSPARFSLAPGASRDVIVSIVVPSAAEPGDYFALVKAQTVSDQPGATSVGVAAATKLTFSVGSAGWLEAQWLSLNRRLDDAAPWTYIIPGALLLAFLANRARRLPFRLRIERR